MSEGPGALTEADKDRIAAVIHEGVERFLSGDPALWNGGNPEEKLNEWIDEQITLSPEAQLFALALARQIIAADDEHGRDPVIDRIDRADGGEVPRD
jgi:hypothetical protein